MVEMKKKEVPIWAWIIFFLAIVILIGNFGDITRIDSSPTGTGLTGSSGSSATVEYEWVTVQTIEFDSWETWLELIFEEDYETFTAPDDATYWGVYVEWEGGDKDSYITLTFWRFGEDDDVKVGRIYKNSKQGEESWTKSIRGDDRTFYVEASAINDLKGTIYVNVYVPK